MIANSTTAEPKWKKTSVNLSCPFPFSEVAYPLGDIYSSVSSIAVAKDQKS